MSERKPTPLVPQRKAAHAPSRINDHAASKPVAESPEWTGEMLVKARGLELVAKKFGSEHAESLRKMGRPAKADRKINQTLRLDPDVIAAFRATGAGWQARVNNVLRAHLPTEQNG